MFFRSNRSQSPRDHPCAAEDSDAGIPDSTAQQTQQPQDWLRSAQRVTRVGNAWLAAEGRDRGVRYGVFVAALADEERAAAEVERMLDLTDAGHCVATTDPRHGRLDTR